MTLLRDADPSDAPVLAAILGGWVAKTAWMPKLHTTDEDLGFVTRLIAHETVRVAGMPATAFLARKGSQISQLQVAPVARRQGIGRALVRDAQAGSVLLNLWTHQANEPAIAFWQAMGFVEIARSDGRQNEESLLDIRLEWRAA